MAARSSTSSPSGMSRRRRLLRVSYPAIRVTRKSELAQLMRGDELSYVYRDGQEARATWIVGAMGSSVSRRCSGVRHVPHRVRGRTAVVARRRRHGDLPFSFVRDPMAVAVDVPCGP